MESQLDDWMSAFHTLLAYSHDGLAAADAGGDPSREGALDGVKAAVCANAALFLEINDEEFAKFLQTFVTDAWHTLLAVRRASTHTTRKGMVMAAGGWCSACRGSLLRDCCCLLGSVEP
jgi:Cse1